MLSYDLEQFVRLRRPERRFAPMAQENEKATRDWRQIIADSYKESDPEMIRKLAEELDRALDRRDKIPFKPERDSFSRKKSA
jgi:hypothetical protein